MKAFRSLPMLATILTLGCAKTAAPKPFTLTGTWTLVAADKLLPNGTRVHDYGLSPQGRFIVDARGRYVMQIDRTDRPNFASGDRAKGTPAEYRAAILGLSTHFGRVSVDAKDHILIFRIKDASFPNLRGTVQKRHFDYRDGVLSYRVAPRPDGSVPISVWKRLN